MCVIYHLELVTRNVLKVSYPQTSAQTSKACYLRKNRRRGSHAFVFVTANRKFFGGQIF